MNAITQVELTETTRMLEDDILDTAKELHKAAITLSKKTAEANEVRSSIREIREKIQMAVAQEKDDEFMDLSKQLKSLNNKLDKAIDAYNAAESGRDEHLAKLVATIRGAA